MLLQGIDAKRVALVAVVLVSDIFFTGLVFGWAPLLLMLQEEHQYAELCNGKNQCVEQENRLNLMFALASVAANAGALPIGMFLDYCGPKIAISVAATVEITGLVLMAFADSQTFDVFVPAYVLLAFGGCITMMTSFPASFLIMKYQTAILAAISCLFDGSSVIFLVLYSIRSTFGATRTQLFLGLACVAALVYLVLIVLWHVNEHSLHDAHDATTQAQEMQPLVAHASDDEAKHKAAKQLVRSTSLRYGSLTEEEFAAAHDTEELRALYTSGAVENVLLDAPLKRQILTFEFAFVLLFAATQVLRTTVYIGTTNKLLENYGDAQEGYLYTKVFSFVLPMGFLFVPFIDYVVESKGLTLSLIFTNVIGVIYNAMVLVPSLPLQCLTFFVFTGFRAFLYAVMSAFAAKTFGLKNLGTLVGSIFTVSSIVSLVEYPAVYISNVRFGGDLSVVYWISLLLCVGLFPFTEVYRKRENARHATHEKLLHAMDGGASPAKDHMQGLSYMRSPMMRSPNVKAFVNA
ncbi:TPA: hypothetical protein N0F65_009420 [Lagenidium giganteum]|uniref:MFS transporter n=1 Tax=Lagenidium giganteum TaxID=4803 RepID=A0AAV2ZAS7_9STRA|nr:TPA: hypothetical protein N0F65_009420 [Lagenidium giganteum]